MLLPFPQDDTPIDESKIRKIRHKNEWYFSVIDIIAWLMTTDHKKAKSYWSTLKQRLKEEGNETVTNCDQLKLFAPDGKMRLTDVINREQGLRLVQSVPSPRAEPMKLWLAKQGAEKLAELEVVDVEVIEIEDPEAKIFEMYEQAVGEYRRRGKTESWIEARIQGIVTRKEFVQALKNAVLNANPELYAQSTERLYEGLWQRTTAGLRHDLEIRPKDNPRDHFGEYALIYTRLAEKLASDKLGQAETVSFAKALEVVWHVAKEISKQAKATSKMLGMDLVTERPLLSRRTQ